MTFAVLVNAWWGEFYHSPLQKRWHFFKIPRVIAIHCHCRLQPVRCVRAALGTYNAKREELRWKLKEDFEVLVLSMVGIYNPGLTIIYEILSIKSLMSWCLKCLNKTAFLRGKTSSYAVEKALNRLKFPWRTLPTLIVSCSCWVSPISAKKNWWISNFTPKSTSHQRFNDTLPETNIAPKNGWLEY